MNGIRYLADDRGDRSAAVLDLRLHGQLREDLYDAMPANRRRREPRESLAKVKRRLRKAGKLNAHG